MKENIAKDAKNQPIPYKKAYCPKCGKIQLFWFGKARPVCSVCYGESHVAVTDPDFVYQLLKDEGGLEK
jgi:uncharacterized protein (DUF983 family)